MSDLAINQGDFILSDFTAEEEYRQTGRAAGTEGIQYRQHWTLERSRYLNKIQEDQEEAFLILGTNPDLYYDWFHNTFLTEAPKIWPGSGALPFEISTTAFVDPVTSNPMPWRMTGEGLTATPVKKGMWQQTASLEVFGNWATYVDSHEPEVGDNDTITFDAQKGSMTRWTWNDANMKEEYREVPIAGSRTNLQKQFRVHAVLTRFADIAFLTALGAGMLGWEYEDSVPAFDGGDASHEVEIGVDKHQYDPVPTYQLFRCVSENVKPLSLGTNFYRRTQRWETFTAWTNIT